VSFDSSFGGTYAGVDEDRTAVLISAATDVICGFVDVVVVVVIAVVVVVVVVSASSSEEEEKKMSRLRIDGFVDE